MPIYTKTGDHGQTSLVGGQRVSKCCQRLESYGTVDELNSHIGVLITYCSEVGATEFLTHVQADLFVLGGYLATDASAREVRQGNIVMPEMVSAIEGEIDRMQKSLPPLRLFILPGGSRGAAMAHVCRTVCRRAERRIFFMNESTPVDAVILQYMNRLSDYLFVLARKLNFVDGVREKIWKKPLK